MKSLVATCLLVLGSLSLMAQIEYVENGGQWPDRVKYSTLIPGGRMYIEHTGLLINLYDTETTSRVFAHHHGGEPIPHPKKLKQHAYRLNLVGAQTHPNMDGEKPLPGEYAFFLGDDPDNWAGGLHAFKAVIMRDLYPGIDLKLHGTSNPKYDFILHPGADPEAIEIEYEGVKPKLLKDGTVRIQTSVGEILESKPYAFQIIDGKEREVECTYQLEGNSLTFALGAHDPERVVVIDPELVFSTYSGSFADNFGYTATYDIQGHLYSGSTAFGTGYPMTLGAYQTVWAGGQGAGTLPGMDIAISKFSLDGTGLVYSTYLGGSGDEMPHSLVTDSSGALYVFGTTGSMNFPTTDGAFQTDFQGGNPTVLPGTGVNYAQGSDMFVARLSPSGQNLEGSTYLGGTANDGINTPGVLKHNYADEIRGEVDLDPNGGVLVGSCTQSDDFPVTENGYQPSKSGSQDGVVLRLDPFLQNLLNATFIGGSGEDAVYSIHPTPDGKITVGGGTSSHDLDMPADAFGPVYGGGPADGFIATLDGSLEVLESGTYFGTESYDQVYFVEKDENGFPHVFGQTRTPSDYFSFNAEYGQAGRGMFVAKFNPGMTELVWSTTFGSHPGVPSLSPVAFAVDICNRIYLAGWGGSVNGFGGTNGLDITADAFQQTTDNSDFYFMVLSGDASTLDYATFYGGALSPEHVDGGTSRFDRNGNIYQSVCAGCGGNDDLPIYPPDAHSPTNNSFNCNLGVAKINFDMPIVFADFTAEDVCLPDPVVFQNTSNTFSNGNPTYHWDFGDGSESFDTSPTVAFENPGTYEVELIITDPGACNIADTITKTVTVFPEIILDLADSLTSCLETEFEIPATAHGNADLYTWAADAEFTNILLEGPTDSVLTHAPQQDGYVYLKATSSICSAVDSIFLSPAPHLTLSLSDTLMCGADTLDISVAFWPENLNPTSIFWTPDTSVLSGQQTGNVTVFADETRTYAVGATSPLGCELSAEVEIKVHPIFLEVDTDTLACTDAPINLTAHTFGSATGFVWSENPDFSIPLNSPSDSVITVVPGAYTYYYIRVENDGCVLTDSVAVSLLSTGTTITPDHMICVGDTATLIVQNDFPGHQLTHAWSPEELILTGQGTPMVQVRVMETTTFSVISTTPQGCEVANAVTVFASPLGNEEAQATAEPRNLLVGQSGQLSGYPQGDGYHYEWDPPIWLGNPQGANTTTTPDETIIYNFTVSDFGSVGFCSKSDTVIVRVFDAICGPPNIFVPNAFSPNGDGENDVLYVRGSTITSFDFAVFDRWGEKVFETTDLNVGWDGTYKGKLAEPAVFVYYLNAVCGPGQTYFEKGNVTVIR